MFLAPINYDKYFSKVFSNERISRRFLEDFLETNITEFEMLKSKQRVTDDAALVEFDFRCKIDNSFVILDMQQWYKRDVSKRFYLYHALNAGLQLEQLPSKRVLYESSFEKIEKVKNIKDYKALQPVLTLVWMVDDSLDFKDDYVAYAMTPELVTRFIRNENLWHQPEIIEILQERSRVLEVLDNQAKELFFLAKNRLIFLLQKNIVKNNNKAKYVKWFEFAQKTKNPDNTEEDFQEYREDEIFCEIIKRLDKRSLTEEDYQYIKDEKKIREEIERFEQQIYQGGWQGGWEGGWQGGWQDGREKGEKEGIEQGIKQMARKLKDKGVAVQFIAEVSGLPPEEIMRL
jgi:hypothetical protein